MRRGRLCYSVVPAIYRLHTYMDKTRIIVKYFSTEVKVYHLAVLFVLI